MGCYSLSSMFSFLLLLAGTIAIVVSIVTAHWSQHSPGAGLLGQLGTEVTLHSGLIESCRSTTRLAGVQFDRQECNNRYVSRVYATTPHSYASTWEQLKENTGDFVSELDMDTFNDKSGVLGSKNVQLWEFCLLMLMTTSVVFGILALLVGPCCCERCGTCLGIYVFMAAMCSGAGVLTYVYYKQAGETVRGFSGFGLEIRVEQESLGWSFWLAAGGAIAQAVSALLFCTGGGENRNHDYHQQI